MLMAMKIWLLLFLSAALLPAATDAKSEQAVLSAMDAFKQAAIAKDRATLQKVLHDDLTYSHSNGRTESKAEAIQAIVSGTPSIDGMDFSEMTVRTYGNTALAKGKVTMHTSEKGQKTDLPLSVLFVWLKGSQGWQLVARQSTRLMP